MWQTFHRLKADLVGTHLGAMKKNFAVKKARAACSRLYSVLPEFPPAWQEDLSLEMGKKEAWITGCRLISETNGSHLTRSAVILQIFLQLILNCSGEIAHSIMSRRQLVQNHSMKSAKNVVMTTQSTQFSISGT